jgi:hypothetical protein
MQFRGINALASIALIAAAIGMAGCGQSVRGELPDVASQTGSVLTADAAKAAAEALVRANEERQSADIARIERRIGTTR